MRLTSTILTLCLLFALPAIAATESIYSIPLRTLEGKKTTLADSKGKVLLVVNTASKCGFTPQYRDLQALHEKYASKGVVVLGFPSNDFMETEPGSNEEIQKFCKVRYGVTFPLFEKGAVTGEKIQPFYKMLLSTAPESHGAPIEWNFEKVIVDKKGVVRERFESVVNPMNARVTSTIEKLILE